MAPGVDYASKPADENDATPAWSLLAGVVSMFYGDHSFRLHRLRVTRSGRVLGQSGDALETMATDLDGNDCVSHLPEQANPLGPISAAGELWAPHLVMRCLDKHGGGQWVEAAAAALPDANASSISITGHGALLAYQLIKDGQTHRLAPPTMVDTVVPHHSEGQGHLVHLGGRVLCAVWIDVNLRCGCDTKHSGLVFHLPDVGHVLEEALVR